LIRNIDIFVLILGVEVEIVSICFHKRIIANTFFTLNHLVLSKILYNRIYILENHTNYSIQMITHQKPF
jgi:hypothetical protein